MPAVVFTGAGGRAFVAGADIQRLGGHTSQTAMQSKMQRVFDDIEAFSKPTIAAVNGFALGVAASWRWPATSGSAESARFGLPETSLAILPAAGGTQ